MFYTEKTRNEEVKNICLFFACEFFQFAEHFSFYRIKCISLLYLDDTDTLSLNLKCNQILAYFSIIQSDLLITGS